MHEICPKMATSCIGSTCFPVEIGMDGYTPFSVKPTYISLCMYIYRYRYQFTLVYNMIPFSEKPLPYRVLNSCRAHDPFYLGSYEVRKLEENWRMMEDSGLILFNTLKYLNTNMFFSMFQIGHRDGKCFSGWISKIIKSWWVSGSHDRCATVSHSVGHSCHIMFKGVSFLLILGLHDYSLMIHVSIYIYTHTLTFMYKEMPLKSLPFSVCLKESQHKACWSAGATKMGYYEKFLAIPKSNFPFAAAVVRLSGFTLTPNDLIFMISPMLLVERWELETQKPSKTIKNHQKPSKRHDFYRVTWHLQPLTRNIQVLNDVLVKAAEERTGFGFSGFVREPTNCEVWVSIYV